MPTVELREVNPVASEVHGFEKHPQSTKIITGTLFMMIM